MAHETNIPSFSAASVQKHYVVAIGASAGGLEAINSFFEKVPEDSGITFVLIQHLSPDYKSMMPELLAKHTRMPVHCIEHETRIVPNQVYTIPAGKNIIIENEILYIEERSNPKTLNLPINIFFKSLAMDLKERAIAVVLSGTGSDATLGIETIKEKGGMILVQDPATAAFTSMPKSAIATGLVDYIQPPSEMPDTILSYTRNPVLVVQPQPPPPDAITTREDADLMLILTLIQRKTRLDFRDYKKATIIRRLERRMGILGVVTLAQYYDYLLNHTTEVEQLSQDILINVTSFFRDPKAFEALNSRVLHPLISNYVDDSEKELRFWVIACSTGQEVYTLAMQLKEQCRKQQKNLRIKIFATDIDPIAIEKASKGVYPETIAQEISPALLHRYFTHAEGGYCVKKELREMVIFARHDITRDPPFHNIHLVCCRNMLIYMEADLQEKILSFIHFSLNEQGALFLGSSETLGIFSKVFEEIDQKHRIFQKRISERIVDLHKLYHPFEKRRRHLESFSRPEENLPTVLSESKVLNNLKDALLEDVIPPTAIITENNDVVHVAGQIENYVRLPKKQLTLNILKMVDERLYVPLSSLLTKVRSHRKKLTSQPLSFNPEEANGQGYIQIVIKPYTEPLSRLVYYMISFIEIYTAEVALSSEQKTVHANEADREKDAHIVRLEDNLKETKEYLQTTIEELETSNEELQATNEELMAANEELQSSNEELQSVNEELYTVNNEFQEKLLEMTQLNDDLNNFIQSTHISTLFLDNDFHIRRFTDAILSLIRITKNDTGRYIGDFTHSFQSFDLMETAQKVMDTFMSVEQEVITTKNTVYLMRALPYKTAKKEVKGVVFTFVDVSDMKKAEKQLQEKATELERINQELEQFAFVASHDLKAPINNLSGLLDLIKTQNGIEPDCMDYFDKIISSVQRLNDTIRSLNEVITLKKNIAIQKEKIKLDDVLEEVLAGIEDQIRNNDVQIHRDFSACQTLEFPAMHLRSILQNLITNAIKYKQKNISPVINISTSLQNTHPILLIRDNGRGIDMNMYGKKLFGLFQRFHLDVEGKGIGLHITKSIIEKYGGHIEVASKLGHGTEFRIFFQN